MRLRAIYNRPKCTISVKSGFELLQMVLELDIERCASEDVGPPKGVDCEILHRLEPARTLSLQGGGLIGEENESFLVRV